MGIIEKGNPFSSSTIYLKGVVKLLIDNQNQTVSLCQFLPGAKNHSLIPFNTGTIISYVIGNDIELYYRKGYLRIVYGIDIDEMSDDGMEGLIKDNIITLPLNIPPTSKKDNEQEGDNNDK